MHKLNQTIFINRERNNVSTSCLTHEFIEFITPSKEVIDRTLKNIGIWHHMVVRLVEGEKLNFFRGKSIVDVGCGSGRYLAYFKYVKNIDLCVGVDITKNRMTEAAKKFRRRNKDVEFLVADAHNLPFKNSAFDIVFSTDVLEHLSNPSLALREIGRVGKSKIGVCLPNRLCPYMYGGRRFGVHERSFIEKYLTRWQLEKLLKQTKFSKSNIHMVEKSFFPLEWLLVRKQVRLPTQLIRIMLRIEKCLESSPLIKHLAGELVAYCTL